MDKLKIILLEDSYIDAELIKMELQKISFNYETIRVDNESDFNDALDNYEPDLVLSDFSLPQFNGLEALQIAVNKKPEIPFIIVTGSLSEEVAAECIKSGAWDYVVKERLFRLSSVIINALKIKKQKEQAKSVMSTLQKFEFIINASPSPMSLINTDHCFEAVNKAFADFYNVKSEKIVGQHVNFIWKYKYNEKIKGLLNKCFSGESIKDTDLIISPNSNKKVYLDINFVPYYNGDEITHVVVSSYDVSNLVATQLKMKENEKKYRFLAENSIDAIWQLDRKFNFIFISPSIKDILGYDPEYIINKNIAEFTTQNEFERFLSFAQKSLYNIKKSNLSTLETNFIHKDGGKIPIEINTKTLLNEKDQIIGLQGAFRDIRTRKIQETQIQKLNTAVTQSPTSIIITDLNGKIEYANPEFTNITGYSIEEVIGKNPNILKTGKTSDEEYQNLWNTIKTGKTWKGEFHNKKKDGSLYWESATISPIRDKEGNIINFIAVKENITKRKSAELSLKANELKTRTILDYSPVAIFQYDMSHIKKYLDTISLSDISQKTFTNNPRKLVKLLKLMKLNGMNLAACKLLEVSSEKDITEKRNKIFTKDTFKHFINGLIVIKNQGRFYECTTDIMSIKGNKKTCLIRFSTTPDNQKDYKLVMATILDITQREKAKKELKHSLKEKEIMLKEIHHRVKNNLQIISSMLNMQKRNIDEKFSMKSYLDSISRVKSMALIHDNMYHSENLEAVDIKIYIHKLFSFLMSNLDKDPAKIILKDTTNNLTIDINKAIPLGLIINEILSNSIKYAFDDSQLGNITINLSQDDKNMFLSIKDDGKGLPKNISINETKTLGLQLVNTLSDQLHAKAKLFDNNGVEFRLIFPIKD